MITMQASRDEAPPASAVRAIADDTDERGAASSASAYASRASAHLRTASSRGAVVRTGSPRLSVDAAAASRYGSVRTTGVRGDTTGEDKSTPTADEYCC